MALILFRTQSTTKSIKSTWDHEMHHEHRFGYGKPIFLVEANGLLLAVWCSKDHFLVAVILAEIESRAKQFFADAEALTAATHRHTVHLASLRSRRAIILGETEISRAELRRQIVINNQNTFEDNQLN